VLDGYDVIMKPEVNGRDRDQGTVSRSRLDLHRSGSFLALANAARSTPHGNHDVIASRLAIAHEELRYVRLFDYLLVNEEAQPHVAVEDLEASSAPNVCASTATPIPGSRNRRN